VGSFRKKEIFIVATASLSLPEGHYLHRYLFLRISALLHRRPAQPSRLIFPELLAELVKSGLFLRVSLYIWKENQQDPAQFHAGDAPVDAPEEALIRADWTLGGNAVSVLALPAESGNDDATHHLLGFVSQQAAQEVHAETLRFVNGALKAQIRDLDEAVHLRKLLDRAASLLVARHGLSPSRAHELLVETSHQRHRPLLAVAQEIVLALGTPAPSRNRRFRTAATAA